MNTNMTRTMAGSILVGTIALAGCTQSDTGGLTVGECVRVEAVDFTFGGDVRDASCSDISILNDVYRVAAVGSESEMDRTCGAFDLIIVDGDDAACLTK